MLQPFKQKSLTCELIHIFLQPSICTLYPPHYDAVSSLASYKDLLFSSCGVTIKQWDSKEKCLKQVSTHILPLTLALMPRSFQAVDGAHSQGNPINSLATFNSPMTPLLVSGCKGGFVKLWNPETCSNVGKYYYYVHVTNFVSFPFAFSSSDPLFVYTGELLAHKNSVNTVAANNTCIFTGSRLVES